MSDLPPKFPCWCRATYSWGGETKKDLGFIEGDLIEALNAGDGLWWVGRLRRDPRAIGSFPSNFVKVLDESFQPTPNSRNASPRNTPPLQVSPQKQKSVFRKPFQAYEVVGRSSLDNEREGTPESDKEKVKKEKSKFRPYSSMKTAQAPVGTVKKTASASPLKVVDNGFRVPSPPPRGGHRTIARAASPQPGSRADMSRQGSIDDRNWHTQSQGVYRTSSQVQHQRTPSNQEYGHPPPMQHYRPQEYDYQRHAPSQYHQRAPFPKPHSRVPSPAPRPHSPLPSTFHDGSAYPQLMRTPSPNPLQQDYHHDRAPSPQPMRQGHHSRAPSPNPTQQGYHSRASSPNPMQQGHHELRAPSPAFDNDLNSSPPPPPPPAHRVVYQSSRAPPPHPYQDQHSQQQCRSRTPIPASPGGSHMTPSPLRDAMNDVMSSLHDMSLYTLPQPAPTASNVWSPDEFELVRKESQSQHMREFKPAHAKHSEDRLGSFVQRMDNQLQRAQSVTDPVPVVPLKGSQHSHASTRPPTAGSSSSHDSYQSQALRKRKSAFDLGRTYTTKTNATNSTEVSSATQSSTSTQLTSRSIMSGHSAGGFSATSAGSLARRKFGLGSKRGQRPISLFDTRSTGDLNGAAKSMAASDAGSGPSYHDSHSSEPVVATWDNEPTENAGVFGGLGTPRTKRSGFFRKMIDSAKTTAKTGAATARATVSGASRPSSRSGSTSPTKSVFGGSRAAGFGNGIASRPASATGAAREMGLGGGNEWMQVRRDVNRSNSLSHKEQEERVERCELLDFMPFRPVEVLHEQAEGDESLDGFAVTEPTDFNTPNLALVDKSTRFINSIPPMISPAALAQNYICRPHRSDVQRLRAIFTWVAERITWEDDFEGEPDSRRVIQSRRGCSQEITSLIRDMCSAVGLHAEVVRGYLKAPGETPDPDSIARGNHWWNAVIVDGEWRVMDASLASPSHPRRSDFSGASSQIAESWYFLARPMEVCYTHIPLLPEQQHIIPAVRHEVLTGLPCACPTYFRHGLELTDFDTSVLHLDGLEMTHLHVVVPEDVECIAEVEARTFARDTDGDLFESGDCIIQRGLSQPEWIAGRKRFTIKALLPPDTTNGTLKVYAGKRGLMHSVKDNPHSLAFAMPLTHTGQNPPYEFFTRHPTPHAQRHDLYVIQPQCSRLVMNNTFVFAVRQHPSALSRFTPDTWGSGNASAGGIRPSSPGVPYARPGSAMSMMSTSASIIQSVSGSQYSDSSSASGNMTNAQLKPAKLAIQTPSQKIIRLTKKDARGESTDTGLVTTWETVIKISERGTWRGLVLADRSARWCVFAEWECV